ncbi:MAG: MarR family transcriptional regulator [Alphaproteobacteria bacterium]
MTDTKSLAKTSANPLFLREDELRQGIEMLFYAYRDFTGEPDAVLHRHDFGRAHHRAIYFIGRNRGMPIGNLLKILKITKQSLARVLTQLVADGFVEQRDSTTDRRQRLLYLTSKGEDLERELSALQCARLARAYREAGADAVDGFRKVLLGLIDAENRAAALRNDE